MFEFTHMLTA